jgi:hypothetical protein
MKNLALATFIAIFILVTAWAWLERKPSPVQASPLTQEVQPLVKRAMKYHNVKFSTCLEGDYFFYRDGQKCRLFTPKFVESLKLHPGI